MAGFHLFPFRTEKLSPPAPMVLHTRGRAGSRRFLTKKPFERDLGGFSAFDKLLPDIPEIPVFPDSPDYSVFQVSLVSPEFPDCPGLLDSPDYLVSAIFLITFILPYPMPVIFFLFLFKPLFLIISVCITLDLMLVSSFLHLLSLDFIRT